MLLWHEEDETDDKCDDDDGPTERVSRDPGDECDEQIIDRLIDYSRYHRAKWSRYRKSECNTPISSSGPQRHDIFARLRGKYAIEWSKWYQLRLSSRDRERGTKSWCRLTNTSEGTWVNRDIDIITWIEGNCSSSCIMESDLGDIGHHDTIRFDWYIHVWEYWYSSWFREEPILYQERYEERYSKQIKDTEFVHVLTKNEKIRLFIDFYAISFGYFSVQKLDIFLELECMFGIFVVEYCSLFWYEHYIDWESLEWG